VYRVFKKGHRIRLTLASANTPTTSNAVPSVLDSAGGQIRLLHGPRYKSNVMLPLRGR
jgi:predicted acyl esterase